MNSKSDYILICAMDILKESGNSGLSMRKIADKANMRLSNVQYYFKTKEILLAALLKAFLLDYNQSIRKLTFPDQVTPKERLTQVLSYLLNSIETNDCSLIFKELWVISARNDAVNIALHEYYIELQKMLYELLKTATNNSCCEHKLNSAVTLLLPFIEGYCVTNSHLRTTPEKLSSQWGELLYTWLY